MTTTHFMYKYKQYVGNLDQNIHAEAVKLRRKAESIPDAVIGASRVLYVYLSNMRNSESTTMALSGVALIRTES